MVDGNTSQWTINLTTPYVYTGGNLIIDVRHDGGPNYSSASFAGESSNGASLHSYNGNAPSIRDFRPKTTFTFVPDTTIRICPAPVGITALNITPTTADITWNPPFSTVTDVNVEWGPVGFEHGTGNPETPTGDTVSLSMLEPGTYYEVHLSSTCTDTTTDFVSFIFRTAAAPVTTFPYSTGFEEQDDQAWTFLNGANGWYLGEAVAKGGTNSMYISNNNGASNAYSTGTTTNSYAYREFVIVDSGSYIVNFDWKGNGENNYDYLDVFMARSEDVDFTVNASSVNRTGWIQLNPSHLNLTPTWSNAGYVIGLGAGNWYLIYHWYNDYSSGNQPPAAIDNIVVKANTCPAPTAFSATQVTATTATLAWTSAGSESEWLIRANGAWIPVTSNPYTVTDLTPGTSYNFELRAYCDEGDTSLVVSTTVATECVDITMPHVETFESYETGSSATFSHCWNRGHMYNYAYDPYVNMDSEHRSKILSFYTSGSQYNWIVLPTIDSEVAINTLALSFDLRKTSSTHNLTFIVGLIDTNVWDGSAEVDTILVINGADVPNTSYGNFEADFTTYTGTKRHIVLINNSSSYSYTYLDNIYLGVSPTCDAPTGIEVAATTTQTITVSAIGNASNYSYSIMQGSTLVAQATVSDTFYTFSGLTTATTYIVSVSAVCVDGTVTTPRTIRVTTDCIPIDTMPYELNLATIANGTTYDLFDPCWPKGDNYSSAGTLYPYITQSAEMYFYGYQSSTCWTIMPELASTLDLADLELTFDARGYSTSGVYDGHLVIGLVPTGNYIPGTTPVDTVFYYNFRYTPDLERQYIHFDSYTGTNRRIIFLSTAPSSSNNYLYLSNISLHDTPPCARPSDILLTTATTDSLAISWAPISEGVDGFVAEYRPVGTTTWLQVTDIVDNNAYIGGLAENTAYDFRVKTDCGNGVSSIWNTTTFRTACVPIHTFPYVQDFQNLSTGSTAAFDYCWNKGASNGNYPYVQSALGSKHLYGYTYGTQYNWAVMPVIADSIAINRLELSLSARFGSNYHYDGYVAKFKVGLIDGDTYVKNVTPVDIIAEITAEIDDWDTYFIPFDTYTGTKRRIVFIIEDDDENYNYVSIDDVNLHLMPACSQRPTHLAVIGATPNTISISYDGTSTDTYSVTWTDTLGTTANATITGTSYTITGLASEMAYTISVTGICASGDSSDTYTVVSATTVTGMGLPYSTGYETGDDVAWTFVQGNNAWYIDTAAHADGSARGLYISDTNGILYRYNNMAASASYAYRTLHFTPGQYEISFDWKGLGDVSYGSYYGYLRAWLAPANVTFTANKLPNNTNPSISYNYADVTPAGWIDLGGPMANASTWQSNAQLIDILAEGTYHLVFMWVNSSSYASSSQPAAVDNVNVVALPCPTPVNFTVDALTDVSATLSWTPRANETSWLITFSDGTTHTVTAIPYTITGLTPDTPYDVELRGICSATDSSRAVPLSFRTNCPTAFTVPYLEEFREFSPCWTNTTVGSTTSTRWRLGVNQSGSLNYISSQAINPGTANDWLISPVITIPTMTTDLNLCYQVAGDTSQSFSDSKAIYEVRVSPTGADSVEAFTQTLLVDTVSSNIFAWRHLPLAAYAGQNVRIAIRNISKNYAYVGICKFGIRYTNEPLYYVYGPSWGYVNDTLSWKAEYQEGSLTGMTLSWTSTMAASGRATITGANTDSLTVVYSGTGVDTMMFVAANAFGADTTRWLVTVHNCSAPISTFPFSESFEAPEAPSGCWQIAYATTSVPDRNVMIHTDNISMDFSPAHAHHGNQAFRFSSYSRVDTGDYTQYLISQEFEGDSMVLSFWCAKSTSNAEYLSVGYSSTTRDTSAFTWGDWFEPTLSWSQFSQAMPAGTKYFAIRYYGNWSYDVYIDDLTVTGRGTACDAPGVVLDTVGENDATITISGQFAASYQVAIVEGTWAEPAESAIATTTDTTYTFNGLTANTEYTVGVRAVCAGGLTSDWVTVTLTTAEHPCFVPTNVTTSLVTFDGVTVGWTPGENETSWEVNVTGPSYDQTFATTTNPYAVTGLNAGETYTVKVRAICSETQQSDWSEPAQFTTERCQPVSGVAANATEPTTATVTWNPASNGNGNYEVEYGMTGFRQGNGTRVTVNGATTYTLTGLDENSSYDVYVRTFCDATLTSEWSSVVTFTTPEEVGIDNVEGSDIALYPNPARTTVTINGLESGSTVTVVDLNGRVVLTSTDATLDVSDLAQGAYFVRIVGERQNAIRKLIVK